LLSYFGKGRSFLFKKTQLVRHTTVGSPQIDRRRGKLFLSIPRRETVFPIKGEILTPSGALVVLVLSRRWRGVTSLKPLATSAGAVFEMLLARGQLQELFRALPWQHSCLGLSPLLA